MAIAIRMAMMRTTTMSSMSVNPLSSCILVRRVFSIRCHLPSRWLKRSLIGVSDGRDDRLSPHVDPGGISRAARNDYGRPPSGGRPFVAWEVRLLDQLEDPERRQVQGDDDGANRAADDGDHDGLDQRGQGLHGRRHLLVVE